MKQLKITLSALLFVGSNLAFADSSYLGRAPDRGILILVNPNKPTVQSGERLTFKGSIKVVGKKGGNKHDTLLEEFKEQGLEISATFPSSVVDISNAIVLRGISKDEVEFTYESGVVNAADLNQFSIQVFNNLADRQKLKKLASVQAKIEKRIQLLNALRIKNPAKNVIDILNREIAKLQTIADKISSRVNSDENLMAENVFALQVDNLTASKSHISTVMNKFRFIIEAMPGNAIDGMITAFNSKVQYLDKSYSNGSVTASKNESDDDEDESDDGYYKAEFYFNNIKVDSKQSAGAGKNVNLSSEYESPKLKTDANLFSVALYHYEPGKSSSKRIGYLNYVMPVQVDAVKPIWLANSMPNNSTGMIYTKLLDYINLKASDSFGRIDPTTFTSHLVGNRVSGTLINQDVTFSFQKSKVGDGAEYTFTADLNPLEEGLYTLTSDIKDSALNEADSNIVNFRIDRTAPTVLANLDSTALTNKLTSDISVQITDLSPTKTDVYVNNNLAFSTLEKIFPATVNLQVEGKNYIKIISTDMAGNIGTAETIEVVRDTTPAVLTITNPLEGDFVNGVQFVIQAHANETITNAKINGAALNIATDKLTVSGLFTSLREGPLVLDFQTTDLAGNIGHNVVNVQVILRAFNPELVSLHYNQQTNKLIVKGSMGAIRPGIAVHAAGSLFNSGDAVGSADGSFIIELEPTAVVEVSAYDPLVNKTERATLRYGTPDGILLSGVIHDVDDQPLPNAKVTMLGVNVSVFTDANGIFKFTTEQFGSKSIYGDQNIFIDGSTITQGTGATTRKFSIVQIPITISLNEKNVLQRPIYLAPVVMDGTETIVTKTEAAIVTSPHAPGVSLEIPAQSMHFPDNSASGAVSIQEIDVTKSTILPIQEAMPKSVIALEPSGATFSEPVTLTLPNKNEFPVSTELVILLMNSKTGKWEIGGSATVSNDGGSIVTKPDQGIRHFSLAYAAPVGPTVRPVGAKDKPGADTFNGAVTSSISLPTFKSLGQTINLGLTYKSAWARPTALVTNLFDMSPRKVDVVLPESGGSLVDKVTVNLPHCSLKVDIVDNPKPEDIKCYDNYEDFLWDIQYKVTYKNTQSVLTPEKIVASFQTGNLKTPENDPNLIFTGLPELANISYGMELKDPETQNYFSSGIYPYTAHYDVHFKDVTVGTRIVEQKVNLGEPQISEESFSSDVINRVFPQDLVESIYVQNYSNSSAGRGWRINGIQKIVNTAGDKIMIEEASGEIATYSLANNIDTVLDLNGKADLAKGVGLNAWPKVHFINEEATAYQQGDLITGSISEIATPVSMTGVISGYDYYNFTHTVVRQNWECLRHGSFNQCREWGWKYYYDNYPSSSCSKNQQTFSIASHPSQFLMGPNQELLVLDYGRSSVYLAENGLPEMIGGKLKPATLFANNYGVQKDDNLQKIQNLCNSTLGMTCVSSMTYKNNVIGQYNACGATISSSGYMPNTEDLNNPMGMAIGLEPNIIIVADSGHHQIKRLNTLTGSSTVIAGTGRVADSTIGGLALAHDIFYPRGVIYDSVGNLYISSKGGYVRKMDQYGNIKIIAGDAINGKIIDSGDAREMKLSEPYGMVIDKIRNYLYVADTGQNRVIRIDLASLEAKTVAGNRIAGFSGDGKSALEASLNAPSHLGLDNQGNLLIADAGNNRIRRVIFQTTNIGQLAFNPTSEDHSKLVRTNEGLWVRSYRNGLNVYFDNLGRQYAAIDPAGIKTEFSYDIENRLIEIKDPVGQVVHYTYSGDKLVSIIDPANRETTFNYSLSGDLKKVIYSDGTTKEFEYDSFGQLTAEINENNAKTHYIYNAQNRLEKIVKPDSSTVQVADSGSETAGGGELKSAESTLSSITDSNGNKTELAKDFNGYISLVTDALGRTTKIKRDLKGRPIEVTDVDGSITQTTYDSIYGDVIKTVNVSLDIITQSQYNIYGQVISQTDPYGKTVIKTYNGKKQLVKETAPDNKLVTYQYNDLGLISVKSNYNSSGELVSQMSYEYNSLGQLIKQTDISGKYYAYDYDLAGNVISTTSNITDSLQAVTQYVYDAKNQLTKVISSKGEMTEYKYSPMGELIQIKDPQGKITSFEYNNVGKLIKKIDTVGRIYEMQYDANGNLSIEKDPAGQIKRYTYNEINKVTKLQTGDDVFQYEYNFKDEVIKIMNNSATINYTRDAKQRVIQETVVGTNYPESTINVEYSKNDLRIALHSQFQDIIYNYNPDSYRLISLNSSSTGNYGFSFDNAGKLVQIARAGSTTNYSYELGSNLAKISHKAAGTEIGFHEYRYDLRNFITQKRNITSSWNYSYDTNGQLLSSTSTEYINGNESFSYDALGNRLTSNGTSFSYDRSGQQLEDDGQYRYMYDPNGNVIYKSSKSDGISYTFEYSALNQLKKVIVTSAPLNGNVLKIVEYKYDPQGRRILRTVTDNVDSTKSKTQKFYYDGDNIIAEVDGNNSLVASYTYSPLRPDDILGAKFENSSVSNVYYLKDHLNTIGEIVDGSGNILQKIEYSSFGLIRSVKDGAGTEVGFENAPVKSSFAYTGREYEPELNLYYYRARYYDPSISRFLQRDPDPGKIGDPQTVLNSYAYVGNNPIMNIDPTGRFWVLAAMFGVFGKDVQKIAILGSALIIGALAGPIAAGYLGLAAGTAGGVITSTLVGAAAGGAFSAIAYPAFGIGTPTEGFMAGAIAGGIGGMLAGFGAFGKYPVKSFKTGNIVKGINSTINNSIKGLANGPAEGFGSSWTGAEFINASSDFAGFLASIEPTLTGIAVGAGLNYLTYSCANGNCIIPEISFDTTF